MSEQRPHVVVLGAGVIGLTAAVFLAESDYAVTVIAAHVPGDESIEYTSPWQVYPTQQMPFHRAGAHWRTHATSNEPELCDWDTQTFRYWSDLIDSHGKTQDRSLPDPCVKMQTFYHLYDSPSGPPSADKWWFPLVPNFTVLSPSDDPVVQAINKSISSSSSSSSPSPKVSWAAKCSSMSLDAPKYLEYLLARARKAGVVIFRSRLPVDGGLGKALEAAQGICAAIGRSSSSSSKAKEGSVDVWINATGLGARALCKDEKLFPIKGQTVLVKGEAEAIRTRLGEGFLSYCIPRPGSGTTILGGTKVEGDWSPEISETATKKILERAGLMVPELRTGKDGGFEVVSVQCGLRPGREGGPRVEKEVVEGWKVVHSYGHAGAGYQNSVGNTRKVVRLVEEFLGEERSAKL